MKNPFTPRPSKLRGFTLVELLVVIAIIAVLATVVFGIASKVRSKAATAKRISDIRQTGSILLGIAAENNGRCTYFAGGAGNYDFQYYNMLRDDLGLTRSASNLLEIAHWNVEKLPPNSGPWNCTAVNFQDVTYPDGTQVIWKRQTSIDRANRSGAVNALSIASVPHPESYPLLIDSSRSNGDEIFRINESNGDCVGLRESGKASAFLFDGSARLMDKAALKKAGFKKAFDNSTTPPQAIRF